MRARRPSAALLLATLALGGCRGLPDEQAEALVRRYDAKLIEAYRLGDERIVEGLVGDEEAKKILGLIGVKSDMGITLDATLTELRFAGVERPRGGDVHVLTEERWHYRDRRIGSGETVGQESDDHYFMRYVLRKQKESWVVASVSFEREPEVGRTVVPNRAAAEVFHGSTKPSAETAPDAGRPGKGSR